MLTSPSGKSYIGQTFRTIDERFGEHQQKGSQCLAIFNAIQKYGWDNFDKEWYECPDDDLNKHEELMVEVLGTLAPGGYNLKGGGNNGKLSEETKKKIGLSHRGDKCYMYGKPHGEETRQKMSEAQRGEKSHMYGTTRSEEIKQKISKTKLGTKMSEGTKQKMSKAKKGERNHKSKRVYQYDLEGKLLGSFGTSGEAGEHLKKKDGSKIRACARGESKTAYGFVWTHAQPSV